MRSRVAIVIACAVAFTAAGVGGAKAGPSPHMRIVVGAPGISGVPGIGCIVGMVIDGGVDDPNIRPGVLVVIPAVTGTRGIGIGQLPPSPCISTRG